MTAHNPLSPRPAPDPWPGSYRGPELRLTIEAAAGGAYAGALERGDERWPLEARATGAALEGRFQAHGAAFPFTATRSGDEVALESGGGTYRLQRERAAESPVAVAVAGAAPADDAWPTETHPLGYRLSYPPGWTLEQNQAGLVLSPPDLARDPSGQPLELHVLNTAPAQGVAAPDDPRVAQLLVQTLGQLFPFLRPVGAPVAERLGARAAVTLRWAGKNPLGRDIAALALGIIMDESLVALLGIGEPPRLAQREPLLRRVLASLDKGQARRDPRLVGVWQHERYHSSGTFSSTSLRTLTLLPDGACRDGSRTFASMEHRDSGGSAYATSDVDSGDASPDRGTWAADGRRLVMRWGAGASASLEEYEYEVTSGNLLLKGRGEPRPYQRLR